MLLFYLTNIKTVVFIVVLSCMTCKINEFLLDNIIKLFYTVNASSLSTYAISQRLMKISLLSNNILNFYFRFLVWIRMTFSYEFSFFIIIIEIIIKIVREDRCISRKTENDGLKISFSFSFLENAYLYKNIKANSLYVFFTTAYWIW